ncbi:nodulation protein NfeD [Bacteroidales bacterium OttesenSCG-928-I21]|nr:nodulation protein NfeD [Bacteroidales bacterium OttesenSCG-928-I21]
MKKIIPQYFLLIFLSLSASLFSQNVEKKDSVFYVINVKDDISSTTWLYVKNGFAEAEKISADAIFIHMNTYGGEVVFADSIRTKILNSQEPVYVFIDNNAASAGALISIACDKIFMRKGANIGAATVVDQSGSQMPDKYQSYMRATIRSTAEAHGKDTIINGKDTTYRWKRDPLIAEAMVDTRVVVPGLIDSTQVLTFTAEEAMKYNYCDGIAKNIPQIIEEYLHVSDYEIKEYKPTVWDNIKGFLTSPVLRGLLIMIIIGGIYFELQTPGIGFPLIAAICAAILYFSPLYIDGLAENWEILIFIIGLVLLGLEIFVIPGFGVAGISGIFLVIAGLVLSLVGNVSFDFSGVETREISEAVLTVVLGMLSAAVLSIYLSSKIGTTGIFRKVAMMKTMDNEDGYVAVPTEQKSLIGEIGIAETVLRPSGKVTVEGKMYDAVSEDGFIEKGTTVKIIRYETGQIYVEKV